MRPPQRAPLCAGAWHVSAIFFASNATRARSRSPARFLRTGSGAGLRGAHATSAHELQASVKIAPRFPGA